MDTFRRAQDALVALTIYGSEPPEDLALVESDSKQESPCRPLFTSSEENVDTNSALGQSCFVLVLQGPRVNRKQTIQATRTTSFFEKLY